jgi:signal transduction histidine kinase/PAS domain-containing protein/CheY-like chemotaxis protein
MNGNRLMLKTMRRLLNGARSTSQTEQALRAAVADLQEQIAERKLGDDLRTAQNGVLELAVKDIPLHTALDEIVRLVETSSKSHVLASILMLDADGAHLRHGAAPSLPDAYNRVIDGMSIGPGMGSCGTAAYSRKPVYVSDVMSDPLWTDFRALAQQHDLRACWSTPILATSGEILGTFAMYYRVPREPTAEDLEIIEFVVRAAALVISRKRSEAALRESEERLRMALTAGRGIGTWMWDVPSDRVVADARFAELYRVPVSQASVGAPIEAFFKAIHPDDIPHVRAEVEEALRTGEPFSSDYRLLGENGSVRWVTAQGQAELSPEGTPLRFPGVSVDISERKAAEQRKNALITLTDRIRDLDDPDDVAFAAAQVLGETLQVSRVGYGTVDPKNETITIERDWNAPGITSLAGVLQFRDYGSYIEDLTRGITVVLADAERDGRTAEKASALSAISARAFVNMPLTEHGGLVALLYLNNAQPRAWPSEDLSFIREVAERTHTARERLRVSAALRASESELRAANETLEQRIAQRTEELSAAAEALRQSQKMEAVGQLTGGLAHDFNNLLAGISGSLELMQTRMRQGRHDEVDRYVIAAQGAVKRAAALTHRLLAFSRRQTLDPKPTNVNRLVTGMEELIRRSVGPLIDVEFVGAAGLWLTHVDPPQLENALLNLCLNARDAMPDGGRITIETANKWLDRTSAVRHDVPEGQYLSLCVTDTGTGMSPNIIAQAFDPFFTTKPIGQGTGLGLSMIYGFAKQSGGQVRIYSEVGQGTTVCIYLPRYHGAGDDEEDSHKTSPPARTSQGQTILVVDDEATVRMLVTDVLVELGYNVIEAADSAAGLKVLNSDVRIDLLVTDVGLPGGMNGRQMADAGRSKRSALNVLFITGYADNAVIGNGHLDPGMAVLTKPFPVEALTARVSEILNPRVQ